MHLIIHIRIHFATWLDTDHPHQNSGHIVCNRSLDRAKDPACLERLVLNYVVLEFGLGPIQLLWAGIQI